MQLPEPYITMCDFFKVFFVNIRRERVVLICIKSGELFKINRSYKLVYNLLVILMWPCVHCFSVQ